MAIADLDRDGLRDVIVVRRPAQPSSAGSGRAPRGTFTERTIAEVTAPAHVRRWISTATAISICWSRALGFLFPNNNRVGSVMRARKRRAPAVHHPRPRRRRRPRCGRAAGDLDGDGDLDLAVAGFGYDDGETSWLENNGDWKFEQHVLLRLSGAINAVPADINGDSRPDIVALISQEWEEIWAFVNDGRGGFTPQMIWGSTNPDFGSSWISVADLDRDGDPDILYTNGDAFDYAPPNSRPWQGVQWLENAGNLHFAFHRIADLPGATSPEAADLDGDGDLDVAAGEREQRLGRPACAEPALAGERRRDAVRDARHRHARRRICMTLAVGDLDGDGKPDAVTGGMHISRPYDRIGRVTAWLSSK